MSGFSISVERVEIGEGETLLQIWEAPIELSRTSPPEDTEMSEAWKVVTSASAYRDCIGASPGTALRVFAREVQDVFGDSGTGPAVHWIASVDADAYDDCKAATMDTALILLSREFKRVHGDRNTEGDE